MRAAVAAVLVLATLANAVVVDKYNAEAVFEFRAWMDKHAKTYENDAAFDHAFHNYLNTKVRVETLNARPGQTAVHAINKFADLSPAEFKQLYLNNAVGQSARAIKESGKLRVAPARAGAVPATFDWRSKHVVTPVKDQQQCGSCWAFSTTENVESMWILGGNKMTILAPEQLVDCDPQSQGCNGGWTYWAFEYLTSQGVGGMETEQSYPYTAGGGNSGPCQFDASKVAAKVANWSYAVPPCETGPCGHQNMTLLRDQLATIGPLSICVNAGSWQTYSSGILGDCPGDADDLDHCVQLVGYNWPGGYWIVRNSWNTDWGVEGYIWVSNKGNQCGIADVVTFAEVGK